MESHRKMGKNNTQRPRKGLKEAKKTEFDGTCQAQGLRGDLTDDTTGD